MCKDLGIQKAAEYLEMKKSKLTAETKDQLDSQMLELVENSVVHRLRVGGQTIGGADALVELLPASNSKTYGISDFDGQKLDRTHVITAISFGYDAAVAANVTNAGQATYENVLSAVPATLQNSTIEIEQDGKPVLSVPVRKLITAAASTAIADGMLKLESFALLKDRTTTKINLRTPGVVDAGANNVPCFSVELHGFSTRPK